MSTATASAPTIDLNELVGPSIAASRQLPWAGDIVGASTDKPITSQELLQEAGLDWDVAVRPLWTKNSKGEFKQHRNAREVYIVDDDETSLGVVKGKYQPFSNRDAFAFGDKLVEDGIATWETAGQQYGGARVFMTMKFSEGISVLDDDQIDLFLFFRTSHDGTTGVSADVVPFRAFCLNQTQLALQTARHRWTVMHSTSITDRLEEARKSLLLTNDYAAELAKDLEKLARTEINMDKAKAIIDKVIEKKRSRRDEVITDILATYEHSATVAPYRGTAYGLLNGVTEYYDHLKTQRTAHARLESIMSSEGAKVRNAVHQKLLALAA